MPPFSIARPHAQCHSSLLRVNHHARIHTTHLHLMQDRASHTCSRQSLQVSWSWRTFHTEDPHAKNARSTKSFHAVCAFYVNHEGHMQQWRSTYFFHALHAGVCYADDKANWTHKNWNKRFIFRINMNTSELLNEIFRNRVSYSNRHFEFDITVVIVIITHCSQHGHFHSTHTARHQK